MEIYYFLKNESETFGQRLFFVTAIAGIFNGLIISLLIGSAGGSGEAVSIQTILIFFVCLFIYARSRQYSMQQSSSIVESVITQIRIRLTDKIRRTDLFSFERMGRNQFYISLAQDTIAISEAARVISGLLSSSVLLIFASLYIAYLSPPAFMVTAGFIVTGILIHRYNSKELDSDLLEASWKEQHFFNLIGHLTEGFKELKVNSAKSNDLYNNYIQKAAQETQEAKIRSSEKIARKVLFAQCFSYILIGFIIFIFPLFFPITQSTLIQVATMILFITSGPLNEAVGALPLVERANVAISNIRKMESELERVPLDEDRPLHPQPFQSLHCADLTFDYRNAQDETLFHIGPIRFDLKRGEVVFVMGGNGAGKSTFLKTLTGLYFPDGGKILWNSREVTRGRLPDYRTSFSIVLQDYHLFDRLYGIQKIDFEIINEMLQRMQIEDKTSVLEDGRFETIRLSAGQKKRLALIVAELDNREICVFDEWAADQDPRFRKYFYEEYLPYLKSRGKTIVAVTHDDKYYHLADRILRMEYGQLKPYQN